MATPVDRTMSQATLCRLARSILDMSLPGKDVSPAKKMLSCRRAGESCKSMEELARDIWDLQEDGLELADAIKASLRKMKKNAWLIWKDEAEWTKDELVEQARDIQKTGISGPDLRFAERMLGKKAATTEWKHFALRSAAIWAHAHGEDDFLAQYLKDDLDFEKEINELKKHIGLVRVEDDTYTFPMPRFPQWNDIYIIPRARFDMAADKLSPETEDQGHGTLETDSDMVDTVARLENAESMDGNENGEIGQFSGHRNDCPPGTEVEDADGGADNKDPLKELGQRTIGPGLDIRAQKCHDQHVDPSLGMDNRVKVNGPPHEAQMDTPETSPPVSRSAADAGNGLNGPENISYDVGPHEPIHGPNFVASSDGPANMDPMEAVNRSTYISAGIPPNLQHKQRQRQSLVRDDSWPALPRKASASLRSAPANNGMRDVAATPQVSMPSPWPHNSTKKFMNTRVGGKLSYKPPSTPDRYKMKVDSGYSMLETWGFALLGQYVGSIPSHRLIKDMMDKWDAQATYRIEEGWFIFSFNSAEDQELVLREGPYFILGRPMLVKQVPDKFSFHRRDIALVPLWVRLHGLGKRYWHPDILGDIGSYIGNPLYMDTVTDAKKRSAYARILVEINLAKPLKKKITLEYDDGDAFDCEFFVENQPKFCKRCCSLGHNDKECTPVSRKPTVTQAQPPKQVTFADVVKAPSHAAAATDKPANATFRLVNRDPSSRVSGVEKIQFDSRPTSVDPAMVERSGGSHNMDGNIGDVSGAPHGLNVPIQDEVSSHNGQIVAAGEDTRAEFSSDDGPEQGHLSEAAMEVMEKLDNLAKGLPPDELRGVMLHLKDMLQKETFDMKAG